MLVKDWIDGFLEWHRDGWPDAGWPADGTASEKLLWTEFMRAFIATRIAEHEARIVSKHVGECPADEHPARIVALVIAMRQRAAIRAEAEAESGGPPSDPTSWGCPLCHDDGLCIVYDPKYDGNAMMMRLCRLPNGKVDRIPFAMRVAAHCTCSKGRWMRGRCPADILPRIPDFAEVIAGRTRWVTSDPTKMEPEPEPEPEESTHP